MDQSKKIFETVQKVINVINESGLPEGALRAAVIKIVATMYRMKAKSE